MTIVRLKADGLYAGYCEENKGYMYTLNNITYIINGNGISIL